LSGARRALTGCFKLKLPVCQVQGERLQDVLSTNYLFVKCKESAYRMF
jgi:hypothetical protein